MAKEFLEYLKEAYGFSCWGKDANIVCYEIVDNIRGVTETFMVGAKGDKVIWRRMKYYLDGTEDECTGRMDCLTPKSENEVRNFIKQLSNTSK